MSSFFYLNLENQWPAFVLKGLSRHPNGDLTLDSLPLAETEKPAELTVADRPFKGPAGIGTDSDGNLYIADPAGHRILRWDACSGEVRPLPCLGGEGSLPGQLRYPRGVMVGPDRALYVVDSGNHRLQVVDLTTLQVRGVWGQPQPWAEPQADDGPGRFNEPWDLVIDADNYIYVLDYGNRRVQKFTCAGRVMSSFWETVAAQPVVPRDPRCIAAAWLAGEERLLIIDGAPASLLVYSMTGGFDAEKTARWELLSVGEPAGVVLIDETLYAGDAETGRVWVFAVEGGLIGPARGYRGPVAGLSVDGRGRLLVHPGAGGTVTRLLPGEAFVETGSFLAGPFAVGEGAVRWHRLQVTAPKVPEGAHLQLFTRTSETAAPPGDVPQKLQDATIEPSLVLRDGWRAAPADLFDVRVLNEAGRYLWIAGVVVGDGKRSPVLQQIRLEYDHEGWLSYLPGIYRRGADGAFLERVLSLCESLLGEQGQRIEGLPELFDPLAAPDERPSESWLDWLAGWLDVVLEEAWPEEKRRGALPEGAALHRIRGTAEGLRRLLYLYTGAPARIEEPFRFARLWALGEASTLGFDTMLAPAHPQGAVVGTTAVLDQSHLIREADYGAPLFEDTAHRFCVLLHAADLRGPGLLEKARQVLEREKPAHTTYHLCLIEPRMRVGFQARVGVDTIVGGPFGDLVLDEPRSLGLDAVLAGRPDRAGKRGTIGRDARIGSRSTMI